MFTNLSHVFLWVRDQQKAKDFYVGRLGFAVGTDVTLEPEHFYGIDSAFRDPSGNQWRMMQPAPVPAAQG